jgi:DNA-directed RNA polymerase specialized sigma24 family protein
VNQQELRSSFNDKMKRGIFSPVARHITNLADQEDRLQEAICMTFEMAARYAERGQVLNDAILVHSCRLRAVDLGRRFVRDDAQPRRDVMHPMNYSQGKVEVLRLDGMLDDDGDFRGQDEVEALVPGLATALQTSPQRDIVSAIDLEAWVASLPEPDQQLLAMRQGGATLKEAAEKLGLSISTVFARLKALGLQLADRAGLPVAGTAPTMA